MNFRYGIWLSLLAYILLAGCAGSAGGDNAVTAHRWRMVDTPPTQPWTGERSQVYTYVLAGDIATGAANESVKSARAVLAKVLSEVGEFSPMPEAGKNPIPTGNVNQFVVPVRAAVSGPPTLEKYDIDLAHDYVAWFASALAGTPAVQTKLQGLGPFLIAIKKPFPQMMAQNGGTWKVSVSESILVFDLSGVEIGSVPLYVNEYKKIVAAGVSATSAPTAWRADLASFLVRVGDVLPRAIAATAQAGEILKGGPAKEKP